MLSTQKLFTDVREVPDTWIFEYFARLDVKLEGREVKINSLFNANDHTPSMYIFWSQRLGKYWFHDFSTGKTGDAIKLVQEVLACSFGTACHAILQAYALNIDKSPPTGTSISYSGEKYQVAEYQIRQWNKEDAGYWTAFHIPSSILEDYKVQPLEGYVMDNELGNRFEVSGGFLYGYFTAANKLYKIYRPKRHVSKFIKVTNYLQGSEQLQGRKCLAIVSSLKDGMSLRSLELDLDFIAPDSETSILPKALIQDVGSRYQQGVVTILDNDEAGLKAMKAYRKQYKISPVWLRLEKDISDSIKKFGPLYVRNRLVPLIDGKLKGATDDGRTGSFSLF